MPPFPEVYAFDIDVLLWSVVLLKNVKPCELTAVDLQRLMNC